MKNSIYEFTREDWNTLYPIHLEDHNPGWKTIFEKEKELILSNIDSTYFERIEYFGSSSIPGLKSKPYIDIFISIPEAYLFDKKLIKAFENLGYFHFEVPAREDIEAYSSFGKGYRVDGKKEQFFHIHMCPSSNIMCEQLGFRDYLIANPEKAIAYEHSKIELANKFKNDRGAYVLGKTEFTKEIIKLWKASKTS